jgi:hypothetical protein
MVKVTDAVTVTTTAPTSFSNASQTTTVTRPTETTYQLWYQSAG